MTRQACHRAGPRRALPARLFALLLALAATGAGAGTLRPVSPADVIEIAAGRPPSAGVVVQDCSTRDGEDPLGDPDDSTLQSRVCIVRIDAEVTGSSCRVTGVPDVIVAPPQNRRIVWWLRGSALTRLSFRNEGIFVRNNAGPAGGPPLRFERDTTQGGGSMPEFFVMRRRTLEPGNRVDYDIQLKDRNGNACTVFDPIVVNRG